MSIKALTDITMTFLAIEKELSNKELKNFVLLTDNILSARRQLETNERLRKL